VHLALRLARYAYVMDRGSVALEGSADQVRDDPRLLRYLAP
jgi:branched-chain amino acid transport system ATP-binding protein